MKLYNVIVVFDSKWQHVLMCLRQKDPFQGLYNFVGGKINNDETGEEAAYRELYEETHIKDIRLKHVHSFYYHLEDMMMEVWCGRLQNNFTVYGDENPLEWISIDEDFFDVNRFAGYGNIGHIIKSIELHKDIF